MSYPAPLFFFAIKPTLSITDFSKILSTPIQESPRKPCPSSPKLSLLPSSSLSSSSTLWNPAAWVYSLEVLRKWIAAALVREGAACRRGRGCAIERVGRAVSAATAFRQGLPATTISALATPP
ncbi:uncharacterized protein LOC103488041 [Cucumis melo]|uniref:Uncharacterized protein LOC103488041 n=1 Tax=Cucumis melo TaxID=3656 RepID=A0A1S3BBY7_CUCME|nr:uncharacterized protein LOC103488041 [Cucumis melo]